MKVAIIAGKTFSKLEDQINDFISQEGIKVLEIQFRPTVDTRAAMVVYEDAQ